VLTDGTSSVPPQNITRQPLRIRIGRTEADMPPASDTTAPQPLSKPGQIPASTRVSSKGGDYQVGVPATSSGRCHCCDTEYAPGALVVADSVGSVLLQHLIAA
jgi:hypothetical protein